jgi:hypothetical protein
MTLSKESPSSSPRLQPPGAGLPWWELLLIRHLVFPRACRKLTWDAAAQRFQEEGARILVIWDALPAERLGERVLVRRLAGIEDSSRYWSAAMTVEHLNIVGAGIRQAISGLRRGEVPARAARIEDVKPRGEAAPAEVRSAFVRLLADAAEAEAVESAIPRGTGPRYAHPWFGPIDAYQWHCLLTLHQGIHRRQLEAIRDGLGAS